MIWCGIVRFSSLNLTKFSQKVIKLPLNILQLRISATQKRCLVPSLWTLAAARVVRPQLAEGHQLQVNLILKAPARELLNSSLMHWVSGKSINYFRGFHLACFLRPSQLPGWLPVAILAESFAISEHFKLALLLIKLAFRAKMQPKSRGVEVRQQPPLTWPRPSISKALKFSRTGRNLQGSLKPSQAISATVCCPQSPVSTNNDNSLDTWWSIAIWGTYFLLWGLLKLF